MVSDRAIYIADADMDGVDELYLASLDAPGTAIKLNADLVAGGNVTGFVVNADQSQLLYRADQDTDDVFELYLVDIDSPGASTRINGLQVAGGDVTPEFMFSPDGSQVVYRADEDSNEVYELFLVNIDSPGFPANLSGPLVNGGDVLNAFRFTPDGSAVIYFADEAINSVYELFLVDVRVPGVSTRVNGPLVAGGDVTADFVITPDSMQVIYRADETANNVVELFMVDLAAPGISTTFSGSMIAAGDVAAGLVLSPDGSRLAYRADQNFNEVYELFVVELSNPGVPVKINRNPANGGDVLGYGFLFSPGSDAIAYVADEDINNIVELYLVELASPAVSIKLSSPLVSGGDLAPGFIFSPDGSQLVYAADQEVDGVTELYLVDRSAPGVSTRLNSPLVAGGNVSVSGFEVSSDGKQLVYLADQDVDEDVALFMLELDTPEVTVQVNPVMPADGDVTGVTLIP